MERSKDIVFLSHCILNQNTVVEPLARSKGAYYDVIRFLMDKGLGIHQMPCPEYRQLGLERKPMTKEEYDTEDYRKLNRSLASDQLDQLETYLKAGYNIVGIIGINNSPTCGIRARKGIYIEELEYEAGLRNISLNMLDIPTDYLDGRESENFLIELLDFIEAGLNS